MNQVDIYGDNYSGYTNQVREASRALVIREGKVLLSHEVNIGQWMLPGGGLEEGETPEQACVREVVEESGFVVFPTNHFLTINEYYEDWKFINKILSFAIGGNPLPLGGGRSLVYL